MEAPRSGVRGSLLNEFDGVIVLAIKRDFEVETGDLLSAAMCD
jgi:hypothetical protein